MQGLPVVPAVICSVTPDMALGHAFAQWCKATRSSMEPQMRIRSFPPFTLLIAAWLSVFAAACSPSTEEGQVSRNGPVVLAAASLQESLERAADGWVAQGNPRPVLTFAGSSALARQVENGAPADLFFSADEEWMDTLERRKMLRPDTRITVLGNRLVLIAPKDSKVTVSLDNPEAFTSALKTDRLAMADPASVPAGKYGKASLEKLGIWPLVKDRIAVGENVRAALALVERGEAPLGVVYATDAAASAKVRVVATFPKDSHPPIHYPLAILKASKHADATGFYAYLLSGDARAIFTRYGFTTPQ